jgi:hypothetical protein
MAYAGARVQAVAIYRVYFTTSPSTETALHKHKQKAYAEHAGYMAGIAYCYEG